IGSPRPLAISLKLSQNSSSRLMLVLCFVMIIECFLMSEDCMVSTVRNAEANWDCFGDVIMTENATRKFQRGIRARKSADGKRNRIVSALAPSVPLSPPTPMMGPGLGVGFELPSFQSRRLSKNSLTIPSLFAGQR